MNPTDQRDPRFAELTALVLAMIADLAAAEAGGRVLPFTAKELGAYYRSLSIKRGIAAALADARDRYAAQVRCELLALDGSGRVVHRELPEGTP